MANIEVRNQGGPSYNQRVEPRFLPALIAGSVAGILGASVWAAIGIITEYQIGLLAIVVGVVVGLAVRVAGRGVDQIYGILGGVLAGLSVVLGNLLTAFGFLAAEEGMSFTEVVLGFDYVYTVELLTLSFAPMDLLFYGIAIWEGYKFSFYVEEGETLDEEDGAQAKAA